MPRKTIVSLEELCWKSITNNLVALQKQAENLPCRFINELYKQSVQHYGTSKLLPAQLFIHKETTAIYNLNAFDLPVIQVIEKIKINCKNLRCLRWYESPRISRNYLSEVTHLNPHIVTLDLSYSACTDHQLSMVNSNCPQLQNLSVKRCKQVTDKSVHSLPLTIVNLNFIDTSVSPKGCRVALKRLPSLKQLHHRSWDKIMKLLDDEKQNFFIERLDCYNYLEPNFDLGQIAARVLPKLSDIRLHFCGQYRTTIISLLRNLNQNITRLDIHFFGGSNVIDLIGYFCPMLQELSLTLGFIEAIDDVTFINLRQRVNCQHVSFEHLRTLQFCAKDLYFPRSEFSKLLTNCHQLESLGVINYHSLTNDVIRGIFLRNPLLNLQTLQFTDCQPFTIEYLTKFVEPVNQLRFLSICHCANISFGEFQSLSTTFKKCNYDIEFSFVK